MTERQREVEELLGAWALGALDPDDAAAVDEALETDLGLARCAADLREVLAAMGELSGQPPPGALRDRLLRRVGELPREMTEPTDPVTAFDHQVEALRQLLSELGDADWLRRAEPYRWTVHELVAHLLVIERYTAGQVELIAAPVPEPVGHLELGRDLIAAEQDRHGAETATSWYRTAKATIDALRRGQGRALESSVEFHGWTFTVETLLIARAFEVWTHTDDIRRATGRPMADPAPEDLRAMSMVSVTSLPLVLPLVDRDIEFGGARVVLTGRGGGTFDLGSTSRRDATVVIDVVDYCRLAARRSAPADLDVDVDGSHEVADALLAAARVFAV